MIRYMMNSKESLEGRKALGTPAAMNSLFGLWPLEEKTISLRIRWSFTTFVLIMVLLLAIYEIFLDCVHTENDADNLYAVTFGMTGLVKMFVYYTHREKLGSNVRSSIEDWSSKDAKNFESIMQTNRNIYKKIAHVLLLIGTSSASMFCVKIFFIDPDSTIEEIFYDAEKPENFMTLIKKRFVLPAACSFKDASQFLYWPIAIGQLFQFAIIVGVNLTCDTFFIAITNHLCGQFEILKIKFSRLIKLFNVHDNRREIGALIDRHRHLLELAEQLESTFNLLVFIQMIMNLLILNVAGYNFLVLLKNGETLSALSNAFVMSFALVQTFMYCYIGDMLTSKGADIAQSVYDSDWYEMPSNFSKDMICIILRSRLSIGLTAGKFFKMTRSTFTDIVRTAVSYLSVLRVLIDEESS